MAFTQIIVPCAGIQPFESDSSAANPAPLLSHWQEFERTELHSESLCMPYEMAYARALELPSDEGEIPWAAFESNALRQPCAWIHPCHLDVGMTDMVMQPVQQLMLTAAESRELLSIIAPLAAQDGITLAFHSSDRWLATGEAFANLECASLSRVQGRSINEWLPDAGEFPQQTKLARLQAEVQMLLYTHPINEARAARRLPAVNSFWIDGAGSLDALPSPSGTIKLETRLQDAADNPSLYASAWGSLLSEWAQQASQAMAQGDEFGITLCGDKNAITWFAAQPNWKHKISSLLGRKPAQNLREML
ncbi:MAG: phosphoglycerate mutase [Brachymonas sp.]|nr:phosphoglycerate mutase [Brachymonas sp.]